MTYLLVVGLSSWIIQDGNYGNFSRGADAAFALEFHAALTLEEFEPERAPAPMLIHMGSAHYELLGQVVHVADDWWAVDVGTLAFREQRPPANLRQGSWVRGDAYLGIDPFFYFERLAHRPGAPALIYDWKIAKIEMQTAPLVEVESRVWKYDEARLGWKEIAETNAWNDGGEYLPEAAYSAPVKVGAQHSLSPIKADGGGGDWNTNTEFNGIGGLRTYIPKTSLTVRRLNFTRAEN